jgi:NAD(P)-dependent dehydrogenase (short-subunit alcohol dehydrogenase family)
VSKVLVIGAAGLIGARVVKALGEERCIRASRNSGERVDISDPRSLAALFEHVGELEGIVCTGGAARYKPWDQLTDEDWTFSLANKLMGQVNRRSLRGEDCPVRRRDHAHDGSGGAISLSRQRDHHHRQRCCRGVRARGGRRAIDFGAHQCGFAGLGRRNASGYGA